MQQYEISYVVDTGNFVFPKEQGFETEKFEEKQLSMEERNIPTKPIWNPTGTFEDFKSFCKMGKIDSDASVNIYWETVKRCAKYSNKDILDLTAEDIQRYIEYCQNKLSHKPATLKNYYFGLSKFYKAYLSKEGIDTIQIKHKRIKKKKLNYLRQSEQKEIMVELMRMREAEGLTKCQQLIRSRNYLIFALGMDCGLRVGEMVSLKKDDINWDMQEIDVINGKGAKDRVVPFSNRVKEALEHYLGLRNYDLNSILLSHNSFYKPKEMGREAVQAIIKIICSALKIRMDENKTKVSVHWLRHTFGSNAVRRGMRLDILKELMGHSNIMTTERYLHYDDNEKRHTYHNLFG